MIWIWMLQLTWAEEHRIDTSSLPNLKRSNFESHVTGWMGLTPDWVQRVYVGQSSEHVTMWVERIQQQHYKETFKEVTPVHSNATLAWQSDNLYIVQFGEVGLSCHGEHALQCVDTLQTQMTSNSTPCGTPTIVEHLENNLYEIQVTQGCQFVFKGGTPIYRADGLFFSDVPDVLTIYNRWAESWQWQFDASRQPTLLIEDTPIPESSLPTK